ncbi:hypothetical protein KCP91_18655 [Microvirga sp. SRT01]|uniref:Preprotein translocase subunit YajC n=1 Tax=Sphingomonas longa TaxID=2778730 RepID=A0ABS2DBV2_9SPHN|nr:MULTISPECIES: hypothetical protein [Alphaproteobacteria]MBM6578409.1 hypothetical protein [Sphingomonas sp. BT552]MBR7711449.1 hypothetical protein [Microvirga sp. SRT01]
MIRSVFVLVPALVLANPVDAQDAPRVALAPYIELSQVVTADLNSGDVLTYSSLAAGIDASIATRRANGQLSYRYERRIAWDDRIGDSDIHSGLARGQVALARGLTLDGGAIAARARNDIRGDAPGILAGNVGNTSQIYGAYVGPSYTTQVGAFGLNAAYQLGYTKVETPTVDGAGPDRRRLDYYDDSWGQLAAASIGTAPGAILPVGLTLSGAYSRETASQLKQRYEGLYGRGDVLLPVSYTVALTAGVGYEKIEASQRDPQVDASGAPVVDGNGRFITDPASPRRIAYRTDGVYYDAGVVWRPNHRTEVRGAVGRRYGSTSYTGSATWQASQSTGVGVVVYDTVTTFGRQLRTGLTALPTSFQVRRDPFGQNFNGCTFGTSGAAPGGCLNDVFQSISTASYRARGIEGVLSSQRGRSTYGVGIGYANRRLYAPANGPGIIVTGLEDENYFGQLFFTRALSRVSGFDSNVFLTYSDTELQDGDGTWSGGATASYYHGFGRLSTTASVGLYAFKVGDFETNWSAQALLGARYTF